MRTTKQTIELVEPLLKVLRNKVLPWTERGAMERAVVAQPDPDHLVKIQKNLPSGISAEHRPLRGRRVTVKGPRDYANHSTRSAFWPEDAMHERRIAHLAWVVSGYTAFQVGNQLLHAREGDLIFLMPEIPFPDGSRPHLEDAHQKDGHCALLWIAYSGDADMMACWICHSQDGRHFEKPFESCYMLSPLAVQLFNALTEEAKLGLPRHVAICNHLLTAIVNCIVRELETGNFFQFSYQMEGEVQKTDNQDPIGKAKSYINAHLHKQLTIDDVAQRVYLSRTQFTRQFRDQCGQSFVEYLTACRFEEAKMLLASTQWSIDMIGKKIGITPSRLRTIFQEQLGLSPREYRQQEQLKQMPTDRQQSEIVRSAR